MDAFVEFIRPCRNAWCPHLRNDALFETNGIHPNTNRGLSTLAKLYIRRYILILKIPMYFNRLS